MQYFEKVHNIISAWNMKGFCLAINALSFSSSSKESLEVRCALLNFRNFIGKNKNKINFDKNIFTWFCYIVEDIFAFKR